MSACELEHVCADIGFLEPLPISGKCFLCVPLVQSAVTQEHRGDSRQGGPIDFWWNVSTHGNDSGDQVRKVDRGAKGRRDTLGKARENNARLALPLSAHGINHPGHIRKVVFNREIAVLARHPRRHHLVRASLIKAMEPLDGHESPALGSRNGPKTLELNGRVFGVAMEPDEKWRRVARFRLRENEVATVGCDRQRALEGQPDYCKKNRGYSERKPTIGSMAAARRAGSALAITPTMSSSATTAATVRPSKGETP
jgi:hypothetical protein